jgi:hypothetical protein
MKIILLKMLWSIVWPMILKLLGITKGVFVATMNAITTAEGMRHADGSPLTSQEKRKYVFDEVTKVFQVSLAGTPDLASAMNSLIELALFYLKSVKVL